MRPLDKSRVPLDEDGNPKKYKSYESARRDLIDLIGQYCSYCNQKLPASLAVEHVQPKDPVPELKLEWSNFLLACTNCNSNKGKRPVNLTDFIWPDVHNTHLAYHYLDDGSIEVSSNLPDSTKDKAQKLLDLVGLQKYSNSPEDSDRRWKNRKATFGKAKEVLKLFLDAKDKGAEDEFIRLIGILVPEAGFFSIWLQVFDHYSDVKKEIISSFGNIPQGCFDETFKAVNRTAEL